MFIYLSLIVIFLIVTLILVKSCLLKETFNFDRKNMYNTKPEIIDSKLVVILPIRDRDSELNEYLNRMIPIFNKQDIDYKIYIVEQSNSEKFNKAKLNNIGFLESIKTDKLYNRYLFNDIDNYPIHEVILYKTDLEDIHHFFGFDHCLGGFFTISKYNFIKMNGYSNQFWGWGGEDTDLQHRAEVCKIKINRDQKISRFNKYGIQEQTLINDPIINEYEKRINSKFNNTLKFKKKKLYQKNIDNLKKDGLNTCKYKILHEHSLTPKITRLLVSI